MTKSLSTRLALVLFIVVFAIGVVFFLMVNTFANTYQKEVRQRLHADLANNLVKEANYLQGGKINEDALKKAFHMLMVINPAIEVYLLDTTGRILGYSAPEGHVKRHSISLQPVHAYLEKKSFPILGDDPRSNRKTVFSVAPIIENSQTTGYLYVVLGGEAYQNVVNRLEASYITQITTGGLVASVVVALLTGMLLFRVLTRRLRILNALMADYAKETKNNDIRYPRKSDIKDEIDELGLRFNEMAERIDEALDAVLRNDAKRRELIANVSHDLRTPLATLQGYLETLSLKSDSLSEEEREKYLAITLNQSKQLSRLVDELFELAKLDSCETLLNVEPFSLAELAQDVSQKFLLAAHTKGITLDIELQEIPFAYGDIGMIQRVLENLIENAIRHTNRGGAVNVSLKTNQNRIAVEIADTGVGIPKQSIDNIFERFYRVEKERGANAKHAGLGLAIVKRILSLHGSDIKTKSEVDKGTCFSFELPIYQT